MKLTYFTECLQSFDHLQSEGSDSETAPTVVVSEKSCQLWQIQFQWIINTY